MVKAESFVPPTEGAETRILWLGIFSVRDGPLDQGVLDKKFAKPLDQGMLDLVGKVFMKFVSAASFSEPLSRAATKSLLFLIFLFPTGGALSLVPIECQRGNGRRKIGPH